MQTFRELRVWQRSHDLVLDIYKMTVKFPQEEKFGLISQLRRSISSVPTNIVEGFKRKGKKDFCHFLNLAESSLEETKYHLILSKDLDYICSETYAALNSKCEEIGRMLSRLQQKLNEKHKEESRST